MEDEDPALPRGPPPAFRSRSRASVTQMQTGLCGAVVAVTSKALGLCFLEHHQVQKR